MIALVLTTRHQLANIDQDNATLGTVTSVRTARSESFPWHQELPIEHLHPARRASTSVHIAREPENIAPPSLVDLTLDVLHCSQHVKELSLDPRMHIPSEADLPYLWDIPALKGRDDTRSESLQRKKVYISAATLVIVPDILVAQWLAEISKHVKEDALDYIKIEKGDTVPDEQELCRLDLVLICESKVRSEESRFWAQCAQARQKRWLDTTDSHASAIPICRCPYSKNTREIACRCKRVVDRGISPLVGVYWKRLIVDEG